MVAKQYQIAKSYSALSLVKTVKIKIAEQAISTVDLRHYLACRFDLLLHKDFQ